MLAILLFLSFFKLFSTPAHASSQAIIINQVRGEESCCQPGSLKNLKQQIQLHQQLNIPAHFLVRYDTLNNPSFVANLKNTNLGILVEITPSLAQDAGVNYLATSQNSHQAQHAFTIGYSPKDRIKLVDQLFTRFYQRFNFYPQFSGGWMIDTPTLNHLQDKYQIKAHLITREQWGTDTYHLYGGPPHYPYPASRSWLFMPDYQNPSPVLILRQTITDPLYNYGDTTSSFTSQPNDYLNAGKNIDYFKHLLNQALFNQPHTGFALLGLENSMEEKYQQEFKLQLEYLKKLHQNNQVIFPSLNDLAKTWTNLPITTYTNGQATWVTTPNYRVRIITKNNQTLITDLRLYHPQLQDPYTNYQAVKEGYWITPYLIDGSLNQQQEKITRSFWLKLFGPPPSPPSFTKPHSDLLNQTTALTIPQNPIFNQDSIVFNHANINQFKYQNLNPPNHPIHFNELNNGFSLSWKLDQKTSHQLKANCQDSQCTISFNLDPSLTTLAYKQQYPFLFPERKPRPVDQKNTVLYVHNRYAIANRNPVRVIFIPKDKFGLPIIPEEEEKVDFVTTPLVTTSNQQDQSNQIIDLTSNQPVSTQLTITFQPKADQPLAEKSTTVFFAPNCKQNLKYCLLHPRQALWYTKAIIHDKIRLNFFGEQQ